MILKALCDYYQRSKNLPPFGLEEKQIGFLLVINKDGDFLRFEDRRNEDRKSAASFLVKKSVGRSSAPVANYLYDNSAYIFGYGDKDPEKYYNTFKAKVEEVYEKTPGNPNLSALHKFYQKAPDQHLARMKEDPLWNDIVKSLSKKYAVFSFLLEGETKIMAEKQELIALLKDDKEGEESICLVTGKYGHPVETTSATMIPGSQATAKLVAFQVKSGYDSYGKTQGANAPISEEAEFAYTTALNTMLGSPSRNKFLIASRTFVFWASSDSEASRKAEECVFDMLGFAGNDDDPNSHIDKVKEVFKGIYSGTIKTDVGDRFYILGLAPNSARIAVIYWADILLKDFATTISKHFDDMQIMDTRKEKKPYVGLKSILGAVTMSGKASDATPNLPDAVVKSIFQGYPYPYTLLSACIRRIRAEQKIGITRAAILKAYLNRINDNNKKLEVMLDKENTNPGYLCGRLFAVLDKIQEDANGINSIRERYMNAASATPAAVFATILKLSQRHQDNLPTKGKQIYYDKLKQEILSKLDAYGFLSHLSLQDQGRFFVGYYHQYQDFFISKQEDNNNQQ